MENPFYDKNYFPEKKGNGRLQGILLTLSLLCFLIAFVLYNTNSSYGAKTFGCESKIDKVFVKGLSPGICPSPHACASAALYKYKNYYTDYSTGQPACIEKTGEDKFVKCYSLDTCNGGFICKKELCVDE